MSRVIFMCGPSGSGKSTWARRLEDAGMTRLSFDVEMWRRGITTVPLPPEVRAEIEAGLRARLLELVAAGHADDVVLPDDLTARYFDHFEPPTADEGPLTVVGQRGET